MKDSRTIIILLLLLVFGQAAIAQSTAFRPYEGALHTYTCNGISAGARYDFFITANADGSVRYDDGLTGEFDILDATGVVGTDGLASTGIQWKLGASAHIYYLWLEATDQGGCSNRINIQVSPQVNQFNLLSENIPADNTVSCPSTAGINGFSAMASAYDAGSTALKFKVRRVNGTEDKSTIQSDDTYSWYFEPVLSVDPLINNDITIISVEGANSGTLLPNARHIYTVNGADNEVTVTVVVRNIPGTFQDVKLMIRNQGENRSNLPDSKTSDDVVKHRLEVLPVIEGFSGV